MGVDCKHNLKKTQMKFKQKKNTNEILTTLGRKKILMILKGKKLRRIVQNACDKIRSP